MRKYLPELPSSTSFSLSLAISVISINASILSILLMADINYATFYNGNMPFLIIKVYTTTNRDFMLPGIAITAGVNLMPSFKYILRCFKMLRRTGLFTACFFKSIFTFSFSLKTLFPADEQVQFQ
jgi:hypothetical protein